MEEAGTQLTQLEALLVGATAVPGTTAAVTASAQLLGGMRIAVAIVACHLLTLNPSLAYHRECYRLAADVAAAMLGSGQRLLASASGPAWAAQASGPGVAAFWAQSLLTAQAGAMSAAISLMKLPNNHAAFSAFCRTSARPEALLPWLESASAVAAQLGSEGRFVAHRGRKCRS